MSITLLVLSTCCLVLVVATSVPLFLSQDVELLFEHFVQEHDRQYTSEHEKLIRFQIFQDNLERAKRMNEKSKFAEFGITRFMDLTTDEFLKKHTGLWQPGSNNLRFDCKVIHNHEIPYSDTPKRFDWRDHKAVTPVKQQMDSTSSTLFSATGSIEGQYAIKYNDLLSFSEQQIIECMSDHGEGSVIDVLRYIKDTGGLETAFDYPYTKEQGNCSFDESKVKVKVSGCTKYNISSQYKLKQLVYSTAPISIAINSEHIQLYRGGILMNSDCGEGIANHAALLVGFGDTSDKNGIPYWIVKTSWGDQFGEHGYIRIQRGEDQNSCSIMNHYIVSANIA